MITYLIKLLFGADPYGRARRPIPRFRGVYYNPSHKGWLGEQETSDSLHSSLDADLYSIHENVIIPSGNGRHGTTQIDHIVISAFGLFIIETKNMDGWIFGNEKQAKWTQIHYQAKHQFQNPLRQTFRQKIMLANYLGLNRRNIHELISFVGDCEFKTDMPANVLQSGVDRYIKQFDRRIFDDVDVTRINDRFAQLQAQDSISDDEHIRSIYDRHSSSTHCPRCGSALTKRTAKRGNNVGNIFLGCTGYPRCRFVKDIPDDDES
ncbi:NERD domain-containing protein [Candidatus Puniceispirillum marinum]|uniref:NERD domain-containing protein n=1 Tax=Puniceispirillum marinum (strain IMCC1322) TaxID=488538 RepID=D5BNI1_PUNMI|nr:NERD domain-containing protein [Candidatus Puniceispirillum marinum]ADE38248.1 hypothetical protein SAR116_0005 [Candidatus Puniceispirillum marinum IMCC1322]